MNRRKFLWAGFLLYALLMLWLLFGQRIGFARPGTDWQHLQNACNLVPFRTILSFFDTALHTKSPALLRHALVNLSGNVVMFIPLGFFLGSLSLHRFSRCMLASAAIVLAIELIQLFTLLGSCDIDDLLLNLPGAAIGFALQRRLVPFHTAA